MTNITLQKQHRTLWHFIPGLALSAVITGVALWGGSIPAVAGAGFSALTLAILLGMVLGNTIYPHIWKSCDGGVLFAKQYLLRLGIILYGFRLTFSQMCRVKLLYKNMLVLCRFRDAAPSACIRQKRDWLHYL